MNSEPGNQSSAIDTDPSEPRGQLRRLDLNTEPTKTDRIATDSGGP